MENKIKCITYGEVDNPSTCEVGKFGVTEIRYHVLNDDMRNFFKTCLVLIFCITGIIGALSLPNEFVKFANPEYWAINKLLATFK